MSPFFMLEEQADGIVWLTQVSATEGSLPAFVDELGEWCSAMQARPELKGLVFHLGSRQAGLVENQEFIPREQLEEDELCQLATKGQKVLSRLAQLPFPVVAALDGVCQGIWLELALACDYRVCCDDDAVSLGFPAIHLGLLPCLGSTQRLPRLIGLPGALTLMLSGAAWSAQTACQHGLVDLLVPRALLPDAAKASAGRGKRSVQPWWPRRLWLNAPVLRSWVMGHFREKYRLLDPEHSLAAERILIAVETGFDGGFKVGMDSEALYFAELFASEPCRARRWIHGLRHTRRPDEVNAAGWPVRQVAVLGAGAIGAAVAYLTACHAGLPVRIKDTRLDVVNRALAHVRQEYLRKQQKRRTTEQQLRRHLSLLSGCIDYQGFARVDLILEASLEDLALKQKLVQEALLAGHARTIFATNTAILPVARIAEAAPAPSRVIGVHYFRPVERVPLVEVIPHAGTEPAVLATVMDFLRQQGKLPVVVRDIAGFYVGRILMPYLNEAMKILLEGETITDIDNALLGVGFRHGPLMQLDDLGLDVIARMAPGMALVHGARFAPESLLTTLLQDGRKGRKSGRGFYRHLVGDKRVADNRLYDLLKVLPVRHLDAGLIAERCLLLLLNEAVRCLDEGVIGSVQDADLASVYGAGFPASLGGPFYYMDRLGLDEVIIRLRQQAQQQGERFLPCEGLLRRAEAQERFYD